MKRITNYAFTYMLNNKRKICWKVTNSSYHSSMKMIKIWTNAFVYNPNVYNCSSSLFRRSLDLINLGLNKHTPLIYFTHIQYLAFFLFCANKKEISSIITIKTKTCSYIHSFSPKAKLVLLLLSCRKKIKKNIFFKYT